MSVLFVLTHSGLETEAPSLDATSALAMIFFDGGGEFLARDHIRPVTMPDP